MRAFVDDGRVLADREFIAKTYGLSNRTVRRMVPVHSYLGGVALHELTEEMVAQLRATRPRKRRSLTRRAS